MSSPATPKHSDSANLIETFARSQLAQIKRKTIRESTLLELLSCAFFVGAEQLLRKQSDLSEMQSKANLTQLIMVVCRLGEIKATTLIESVHELAEKYYLLESIIEQGERAAEHWLNCDTEDNPALKQIITKYQDLSMYELGIEGVNKKHLAQQDSLYASTNEDVHRLRIRAIWFIIALAGVAEVIWYYLKHFDKP